MKNRLAILNNREFQRKQQTMKVLTGFGVVVAITIFLIVAMYGRKIRRLTGFTTFFVILFIYAIYAYYTINALRSKTYAKPKMDSYRAVLSDIGDRVVGQGEQMEKQFKEFINDNCECPDEDGTSEADKKKPFPFPKHRLGKNDGLFYYDGTAPQERIIKEVEGPHDYNTQCPEGWSKDGEHCTWPNTYPSSISSLPKSVQKQCLNGELNFSTISIGRKRQIENTCKVNWPKKISKDYSQQCPKGWEIHKSNCLPPNSEEPDNPDCVVPRDFYNMSEIQKKQFEEDCDVSWPLKNYNKIEWTSAPDFGIRTNGRFMPGASLNPYPELDSTSSSTMTPIYEHMSVRGAPAQPLKGVPYSGNMWRPGQRPKDFAIPRVTGVQTSSKCSRISKPLRKKKKDKKLNLENPALRVASLGTWTTF